MSNLDTKTTFGSEDLWVVQCFSLAALGLLAYMQIAPVVYAAS